MKTQKRTSTGRSTAFQKQSPCAENQPQYPNPTAVALLLKHWSIAEHLAYEYRNITGLDQDDIRQNARLSLYKAACHFKEGCGTSFSTYAWTVIRNDLNTLHQKQKRKLINEQNHLSNAAISLYGTPEQAAHSFPTSDHTQKEIERRELRKLFLQETSSMAPRSRLVILGMLNGLNYREIGKLAGLNEVSSKTILSRAFQRVQTSLKTKLKKAGFAPTEEQHRSSSPKELQKKKAA